MNAKLALVAIVASISGLLFGYDTGVINGTQFYFTKYFNLTPALQGWVVGSALLGCFIGSVVAGQMSDLIGRRGSMIVAAVFFTLSSLGSGLPEYVPQSVNVLVLFRLVGGLGIGLASMNAPLYISEISPSRNRGSLVSIYQLGIVFGFLTVFLVTNFIGGNNTQVYNIERGWRIMFWSELIPSLLFLFLLLIIPPSPRWLILKGRLLEAERVLASFQTKDTEPINIENYLLKEEQGENLVIGELLKSKYFKIIIFGSILSLIQQFTGINAVLYYGADIFEKSLGFGEEDVLKQQVLLASVNVACTLMAMLLVDKLGRKPLMIFGSIGMILGFTMLILTLLYDQIGIFSLIGILIFIGSFSISLGPVVWVLLSEMFPSKIRSVAMSVAISVQWVSNFLVSQFFPVIAESEINLNGPFNGSLPYLIFIFCISMGLIFIVKVIPETKGKSLDDMEEEWGS